MKKIMIYPPQNWYFDYPKTNVYYMLRNMDEIHRFTNVATKIEKMDEDCFYGRFRKIVPFIIRCLKYDDTNENYLLYLLSLKLKIPAPRLKKEKVFIEFFLMEKDNKTEVSTLAYTYKEMTPILRRYLKNKLEKITGESMNDLQIAVAEYTKRKLLLEKKKIPQIKEKIDDTDEEEIYMESVYDIEERVFQTFILYKTTTCRICLANIKVGELAFQCICGKIFHPTCAVRVGECPMCGALITKGDAGINDEEINIDDIGKNEQKTTASAGTAEPQIKGVDNSLSVSDLFLIYTDGRLIKSLSFETSLREEIDEDIMSGMLTAVKSFISDSFKEETGSLKTLQYGRMIIYIERGVTIYLAVVFRGKSSDSLRKRMRKTIIDIWKKYKIFLKAWDGSQDGLENIGSDLADYMGLKNIIWEQDETEDDDYQPPKYTGEILTEESGESEMPNVVTIADCTTPHGCYHLYNMLLAKKGLDMRIGPKSNRSEISKVRKKIITIYHPDKWQTDKDKANFFMKKVNLAWEVLSNRPKTSPT